MTKTNEEAISRFIANLGEAQLVMEAISDHLENHMGADPERVDWGHVGSAAEVLVKLRELAAFLNLKVEG